MAQNLLARALPDQLGPVPDRFVNSILSEGVWDLAGDHFLVQEQAAPGMSVRVGSGTAYDKAVVVGAVAGQETFIVRNEDPYIGSGNTDLSIGNGDPSDPRIDLVVLRVYEDEVDSSGLTVARAEVVAGTPASDPEVPATPDGAIALASILVPANESTSIENADITDLRGQSRSTGPAAGGELDYAVTGADQTGISAEADVTGLSLTIDVPAGRTVKVSVSLRMNNATSAGADQMGRVRIKEDATVVKLTDWTLETGAGSTGVAMFRRLQPTAGQHTYKVTAEKVVGVGDLDVLSGAEILVEDIGPA